jgi:hypothetical protein
MKLTVLNVKPAKLKNKVKENIIDNTTAACVERRSHLPISAMREGKMLKKHGFASSVNSHRVAYA